MKRTTAATVSKTAAVSENTGMIGGGR